jgi:hypothetical protein
MNPTILVSKRGVQEQYGIPINTQEDLHRKVNRSGFDAASFCEKDADLCPSTTQSSSVSVR